MSRLETSQIGTTTRIEQVRLNLLADIPTCTRNISGKLVKIITEAAREDPSKIGPIPVGIVGSKMYVLNDFETVLGMREAGISTINALLTEYPSVEMLLVEHVHLNFHPHAIDPLRLHKVVEYLAEQGISRSAIGRFLWIDKRPELAATLQCTITDETRQILTEMMENISKKMYNVVMPTYYITKLAKIADDKQAAAALQIQAITQAKMNSDLRSSWPAPDVINTILQNMEAKREDVPIEKRVYRPDGKKTDASTIKKAKNFIRDTPNLIYIPTKGKGPDLVVDKKTGRVSEAKETEGICTLVGDHGKPVFVIPKQISDFLDAENEEISFYRYTTMKEAQQVLKKAQAGNAKCVIMMQVLHS